MKPLTKDLLKKMLAGDKRALARLMTYIDNRHEDLIALMVELANQVKPSLKIGVTGPPGSGKSTLADKLIAAYRKEGKTVGVVAIDPSSPFSGGAVLGDRIRMQDHNADEGVFIRSLGSRGAHGGLSRATRDIVHLMQAFGFDVILIETVGVGQTELDIMSVADTTLVVLVPESGDTIQTMKAGLMEIADVFVVNKADREGADRIFMELKALAGMYSDTWTVPVLKTVATKNEGVNDVLKAITDHEAHLANHTASQLNRETILKQECFEIVFSEMAQRLDEKIKNNPRFVDLKNQLNEPRQNPYLVANAVLKRVQIK